ncbi:hypothetical protein [Pseudoalteromonas fuliginea]|uniref:Lipoprotein n=1 Tax=Pseudoalteromonas fuliginea TaxID=1872678 RepID=A0ABQ6RNC8_9GAMM|nr:hypothetical protein [Pseudoalteromonas fuliginea]KAA1166167.1 hypothetical protein EU509_00525 [Pseudoalteromonas fuliginea]KAA1169899.1 hypothetical protein EUZ79_00490 [Pseudoalteromonas fuliginea]
MKYRLIIFLFIIINLFGCANTNLNSNVTVKLPEHIIYSGKGLAASAALMGAIGPSGIAIGAAIDIGIGKDIQSKNDRHRLQAEIKKAVNVHNSLEVNVIKNIDLEEIKFKQKGSDKFVILIINGVVTFSTGKQCIINAKSDESYEFTKLKNKKNYANEIVINKVASIIKSRRICQI